MSTKKYFFLNSSAISWDYLRKASLKLQGKGSIGQFCIACIDENSYFDKSKQV